MQVKSISGMNIGGVNFGMKNMTSTPIAPRVNMSSGCDSVSFGNSENSQRTYYIKGNIRDLDDRRFYSNLLKQIDEIPSIKNKTEFKRRLVAGLNFVRQDNSVLDSLAQKYGTDKVPIKGYDIKILYAMFQKPALLALENAAPEAHEEYVDIQFVRRGREGYLVAPLDQCSRSIKLSDKEKTDLKFYDAPDKSELLIGEPGDFFIFFPEDVHAPKLQVPDGSDTVDKIVVKVKI